MNINRLAQLLEKEFNKIYISKENNYVIIEKLELEFIEDDYNNPLITITGRCGREFDSDDKKDLTFEIEFVLKFDSIKDMSNKKYVSGYFKRVLDDMEDAL